MNSCNCNQNFNECGKCARASLKNIAPSCKTIAIIPSITVENLQSIKGLADCFVHVISNNTTYYIDNNGRLTILSEGLVTADNYDILANPLKLQNQLLSTKIDNIQQVVFYDAQRRPHELAVMDNLQDAVNSKIDEMLEDGELEEIVVDYLEPLTKSYVIEEITTETIYVENSKGNAFIVTAPHTDNNGEIIKLQHGFAHDTIAPNAEDPVDFSKRKYATFVSDASIFSTDSVTLPMNSLIGLYIHDSNVIIDNRDLYSENFIKNRYILGIKEDNTLTSYTPFTSADVILNDGVIECLQSFIPIMIDGVNNRSQLVSEGCTYWSSPNFAETEDATPNYDKIYFTLEDGEYEGHFHITSFDVGTTYYEDQGTKYPRQIIGQNQNKDIFFICANGKGSLSNKGLTIYEYYALAKYYDMTFAFMLDGGGSTASVYRNIMLNNPTDDSPNNQDKIDGLGYTIRPVPDFLYFSKEPKSEVDENTNYLLAKIQELEKKIDDLTINENSRMAGMIDTFGTTAPNGQLIIRKRSWNDVSKDYETRGEIYWDNNSAFSRGLSINRVEDGTSEPILRIFDNKDQGIEYFRTKIAIMDQIIKQFDDTTDFNNLGGGFVAGSARKNQQLLNAPFDSTFTTVDWYWVFQYGGNDRRSQIAFSLDGDPIIRVRNVRTNSSSQWKTIMFAE